VIRAPRHENEEERRNKEDRDSEELRPDSGISKTLDNQRQESREAKRADVAHELRPATNPRLRVLERFADFLPLEFLLTIIPSSNFGSDTHDPPIFFVQKPCCLEVIWKQEENRDRDDDSSEPFDDEEPSPARESTYTIHFQQRKGEETTERARESC